MDIPEGKRYFRIGEVSRIIGVKPYVLRYWESEFPQIRPARADSRQRTYQRKDLDIIMEIKRLLHEEKLTLEGARKRLKKHLSKNDPADPAAIIEEIKNELKGIAGLLSE